MESFLRTIQNFGIGRLAAVLGASAGIAAVLIAVMMRLGGEPKSLLYSNLDLKEASQITSTLDQSGVKYEVKGDGSTIMVDRSVVASTRLMLSAKGLPTSGSVGYEIFDNASPLGQTDFVQTLNRQRALEGELARTITSIQGVKSARVHLVLPKRQLFEEDAQSPSASIMVQIQGRQLTNEQIKAIRNLAAGAVPDLKPDRVTLVDQAGELLAGMGDSVGAAASGQRTEVEERIRRTVKDLVEGVVGPGKARVQVTADLDLNRVTVQEEKFDPDGQVVRSTQTGQENANDTKSASSSGVSASQNIPGAQGASGGGSQTGSTSGRQDETTNYEISKTVRTEVQEPGRIKKISVAVAVDGATAPADKKGKPGAYSPRTADEMNRIQQLVRSAVGFDEKRGDQVNVVNVRFDRQAGAEGGVSAASPFAFDKNDILRGVELMVLLVVAALLIFFVVRPMLKAGGGGGPMMAFASAGGGSGAGGGQQAVGYEGVAGGEALALAGPGPSEFDQRIDIARIEGQVKASSVKQVAEFVEKHPEESISILRSWLHEN
ncbi:MAG: flagellar basal-body MS-ring/collar protein FliF [Caulobacteraceae bacterium]